MVECLGPHLLPYLPAALSTLMPTTSSVSDLADVLTLLTQFITRYKAALQPLLASVSGRIGQKWQDHGRNGINGKMSAEIMAVLRKF